MKVKAVTIQNFKRFSHLIIEDIPESAKLVLLVGPNGSGKSSLFDYFNVCLTITKRSGVNFDPEYYAKFQGDYTPDPAHPYPPTASADSVLSNCRVEFHSAPSFDRQNSARHDRKLFYIRSAYRHDADFKSNGLTKLNDILTDEGRPQQLIQPDSRVSKNYSRIVAETVEEIYRPDGNDSKSRKEIRETIVGDVSRSMGNVFGEELQLEGPGNPLEDGTFFFRKGTSTSWRYKNLSGGEKAAFDLLLDYIVKRRHFDNTVFCIDEPELHMHSSLQGKLLKEVYDLTPANCQLWIATHSIGMLRMAKGLHEQNPGAVSFLDFGKRNFDERTEIRPANTNRLFWKTTFQIALGDIADLVAPAMLVACEGRGAYEPGKRKGEFDAQVYRALFADEFPDVEFISLGGSSEVEKNAAIVSVVLGRIMENTKIIRFIDRDDRNEAEVQDLKGEGVRVLPRRHIESYLFDDAVLAAFCQSVSEEQLSGRVLAEKARLLTDAQRAGKPPDDIKSIAGQLYVAIKRELALTRCGSTVEAFSLQNLAPILRNTPNLYLEIKDAMFGQTPGTATPR